MPTEHKLSSSSKLPFSWPPASGCPDPAVQKGAGNMAAVRRRLFLMCAVQQRAKRAQASECAAGEWASGQVGGHGRLPLQLQGMPGGVLRCAKGTDQVSGGRGGRAVALLSPSGRRCGAVLGQHLRLGGLQRQRKGSQLMQATRVTTASSYAAKDHVKQYSFWPASPVH